jgi:hypothetical protein
VIEITLDKETRGDGDKDGEIEGELEADGVTESSAERDTDPERLEIAVDEEVPVVLFVDVDERVMGADRVNTGLLVLYDECDTVLDPVPPTAVPVPATGDVEITGENVPEMLVKKDASGAAVADGQFVDAIVPVMDGVRDRTGEAVGAKVMTPVIEAEVDTEGLAVSENVSSALTD